MLRYTLIWIVLKVSDIKYTEVAKVILLKAQLKVNVFIYLCMYIMGRHVMEAGYSGLFLLCEPVFLSTDC